MYPYHPLITSSSFNLIISIQPDSFVLRATEHPHIFNTMITSAPDDPLLDRAQEGLEGFTEAMRTITNRKDIEFKKIVWQSDWRYENMHCVRRQ